MSNLDANKAIVLQFILASGGQGSLSDLRELLSPDFFIHPFSRRGGRAPGVERYIQDLRQRHVSFSESRRTIDSIVAEGDRVVVRFTNEGIHTGNWGPFSATGPWSHVPLPALPTGKHVRWAMTNEYRIADGKIAEIWEQWDTLGFLQQLGYTPVQGGTATDPVALSDHERYGEELVEQTEYSA